MRISAIQVSLIIIIIILVSIQIESIKNTCEYIINQCSQHLYEECVKIKYLIQQL
jgi:hypothetical protein